MSEFNIGDKVMHFREGLSLIKDNVSLNGMPYFLIVIVNAPDEIIYVPVDNANNIIRTITSKEDALKLVEYIKQIEPEYITNTKQRRDSFKRRLGSGNIYDLAFLSRQLYFFQHPESVQIPVKFGPADVEMLKSAARTMLDELALSFNVDRAEVEQYLYDLIAK